VALVGLLTGGSMLAVGAFVALSFGTTADPNMLGVVLAALGFIGVFAGGLSLLNMLLFALLRRLRDHRE
jgi:hypothetical protein